jgi:hypothetical protein
MGLGSDLRHAYTVIVHVHCFPLHAKEMEEEAYMISRPCIFRAAGKTTTLYGAHRDNYHWPTLFQLPSADTHKNTDVDHVRVHMDDWSTPRL